MRLTRFGWGCLLLTALTLLSAVTTGNNLLYLVYSSLLAALLLSWLWGKLNVRHVTARAVCPDQVFRDVEFPLTIVLRNSGSWPVFGVRAACGAANAGLDRIDSGEEAGFPLRYRFPHRGRNRITDLVVESAFPLGLLLHRRPVFGAGGLALPKLRDVRSGAQLQADAYSSGRPVLRKGAGDDLYSVREQGPGDDARLINWKLTAKTGRPVVTEFSSAEDSKVTIRLASTAEGEVEEAASACRFYIDAGAEVRLVTAQDSLDYGRGLLHLDKLLRHLAGLGEGALARPAGGSTRPPATGLCDSSTLRGLTFLGAAIVYGAMFLIDDLSPAMLLAAAPLIPLGWLLQQRSRWRVPQAVWTACSLFMLFYVTLYDWRASGMTIANTHLLMYLLINRILTELKAKELGQVFLILFLTFFLVSGLTISLWYFPFFLAYLGFASAWLMLAAGARAEKAGSWSPALAACLGAGLILAGLSFAATPRIEGLRKMNPFVSTGLDKFEVKREANVGFTENVSLGFFGELKKSSARVMRVRPANAPAGDARPAPLRIRGAALGTFDGRRWSKRGGDFRFRLGGKEMTSLDGRAWAPRAGKRMTFPASPLGSVTPAYDFVFYPMGSSVLFTVDTPVVVEGAEEAAYFDQTDTVYFAAPYQSGTHYRLYSAPGPIGFSKSIDGYARLLQGSLKLPKGEDPRIAQLAAHITAGADDDLAKARAVEAYLRKAYGYSAFSEGADRTLADFLFKSRRGNCEYFATAGAILLRHAGVPTRLVTGFYSEEWNEFGRFFDVRQGQAHAWFEAYLQGRGWHTFDPTPPQSSFSAGAQAVGRRLERWFNAVQAKWYMNVIGYDQYVQRNTFLRLGFKLSPKVLKFWGRRLVFFCGALFLVFWSRSAWLRLRKQWLSRDADFFERAQAALERAGLTRERHLTPREYAQDVTGRRPELGSIRDLAELHYIRHYGARPLFAEEAVRARALLRELKQRL